MTMCAAFHPSISVDFGEQSLNPQTITPDVQEVLPPFMTPNTEQLK